MIARLERTRTPAPQTTPVGPGIRWPSAGSWLCRAQVGHIVALIAGVGVLRRVEAAGAPRLGGCWMVAVRVTAPVAVATSTIVPWLKAAVPNQTEHHGPKARRHTQPLRKNYSRSPLAIECNPMVASTCKTTQLAIKGVGGESLGGERSWRRWKG